MPNSARAGLFIYAKDAERISQFYQSVAGMTIIHARDDIIVLQSPDIQLVVHKIPAQFADKIVITSPPVKRENTALKFFITVPDLNTTRQVAEQLGGAVFKDNWQGPGFIVCNAMDPEGNVFQVRETAT